MAGSGIKGCVVQNWSETFSCRPALVFTPTSLAEIREILARAVKEGARVRALGYVCSPGPIMKNDGWIILMRKFNRILNVDPVERTITVEGGAMLGSIVAALKEHRLAFPNLPSIATLSAAGVLQTGTHGGSAHRGSLASHVLSLRLLTADGRLLACSRDENADVFSAALCGLGVLGIVVEVTFKAEPAFRLEVFRYALPFTVAMENIDSLAENCDYSRFWYLPHTDRIIAFNATKTSKPIKAPPSSWIVDRLAGVYGLELSLFVSSFVGSLQPAIEKLKYRWLFEKTVEAVVEPEGYFVFDCLFKQYVSEWAVPRESLKSVMLQLRELIRSSSFMVHVPIELRFVARDDAAMLSPSYGGDRVYIGIIMYRPYGREIPRDEYWRSFERIVRSVGGRPHWGKDHPLAAPDFRRLYPRFDEFLQIMERLDPAGTFQNDATQCYLYGKSAARL